MHWPERLRAGDRVGPFVLGKRLGKGGNAVVFRAVDKDKSPVALKVLCEQEHQSHAFNRFRDEVAVMQRMKGEDGILPLLDCSLPLMASRLNPRWLSMPIAAPVLRTLSKPPKLDEVLAAMLCFSDTLARLHSQHIYHRDLKPDNLYVFEGRPCIGDFGLVSYPGKDEITRNSRKLGPAYYHAPEMLSVPANSEGGPADVYSFCKVLWVLATGERFPLPGEQRRTNEAASTRRLVKDSRAIFLDQIIDEGTRIRPEERTSMAKVAEELKHLANPKPSIPATSDLGDILRSISANTSAAQEAADLKMERQVAAQKIAQTVLRRGFDEMVVQLRSVPGLTVGATLQNATGPLDFENTVLSQRTYRPPGEDYVEHGWVQCTAPFSPPLILASGVITSVYGGDVLLTAAHIINGPTAVPLWVQQRRAPVGSAALEAAANEILGHLREILPDALQAFALLVEEKRKDSERETATKQ